MENQHRQITGYRKLSPAEIDILNRIKASAVGVGELLKAISYGNPGGGDAPEGVADARWYMIARTHFQEGFMALSRSIAKPTTF
jgi:hypothetical protein